MTRAIFPRKESFFVAFAAVLAVAFLSQPVFAEAGGSYVGMEACENCHEELVQSFGSTIHNRVQEWEVGGSIPAWGCESCHGPGGNHVDGDGDVAKINHPGDQAADDSAKTCLQCHGAGKQIRWMTSVHMQNQVSCADCHNPHKPQSADKACAKCHADKNAQASLPSHHPIKEGKMSCSSCHDPHGSEPQNLKEGTVFELCVSCHADKEGPWLYEHDPVTENCGYCHDPHGTVANNLRKQNEPFLCLQCHSSHEDSHHEAYTINSWRPSFFTKCTECHNQIHGTDLVSMSNKGRLTR